jgi:hypothetical protein
LSAADIPNIKDARMMRPRPGQSSAAFVVRLCLLTLHGHHAIFAMFELLFVLE